MMTAPRTITKSSLRRTKNGASQDIEIPLSLSFLEQAEVCREQARDAARLKRFRAAVGLFATAANLCRHVSKTGETDDARQLASERLSQIDLEVATYSELARSVGRQG